MTKDYAPPSTTRGNSKSAGKSAPKTKAKGQAKTKAKPKKSGAQVKNSRQSANNQTSAFGRAKLYFSLVVLVAAFGYGLYVLQSIPPAAPIAEKQPRAAAEPKKEVAAPVEEPTQRFKFYDLLPESEVTPPKVSAYQFKEKEKGEKYYYIVQTGSFKSMADAERQKATIAFQGLKASIKSVESQSGTTWHRVSTGPFFTRTDMNSAVDKLVSINIEPLIKKIKKDG